MSYMISKLRGLDAALQTKLEAKGVHTTEQLLEQTTTNKQRTELARSLDTTPVMLKELANRADLMRLKGVGEDFSNLIEEAGVNSCKEMQHRAPEHLQQALAELHTSKHIGHHAPTLAQVSEWVSEAKTLAQTSAE